MKYTFLFSLVLFLNISLISAQQHFSWLIPNTDTSISFNVVPAIVGEKVFLVRDVFLTGFTTFGYRYGSIEAFSLSGTPVFSQKFDPEIAQIIQLIGKRGVLAVNDRLLVATDQTADFDLDPQASVLWCFDTSGNKLWTLEPSFPNSISSCGALLEGNALNEFYHFYFITNNTTGDQYLEFQYLNTDGVILWTKRIFMPLSSQWEYLYSTSAVKLGDEIKVVFSFGSTSGGSLKYESMSLDLQGNLIDFEAIPGEWHEPLIGAVAGASDTFWVASNFKAGVNKIYPCLSAFESSFDQNIGNDCQNGLPNNSSLSVEDFRIDQDGNMYLVGSDPFAAEYLGWMAKYDAAGTLLWNKYYRFSDAFPTGVCRFNALNFTPSGGLVIAGRASEFNAPLAKDYDWLLTLDENGCFNGDCGELVTLPSDIVSTHPVGNESFVPLVFPNPASTYFNLNISRGQNIYQMFKLFHSSGVEVLSIDGFNTADPVKLPLVLTPGLYVWMVVDGAIGVLSGKVTIK
jgi:hypothetical protein